MPRLYHRPPKYGLHKGSKQAIVSLFGQRVYLGPYGSPRSHTEYYRKNGKLTREATLIDDVIRILRKHHATDFLDDFGLAALEILREKMIDELDGSRKHINKQVGRLVRMFKWAVGKELVDPSVPVALKSDAS